MDTSAVSARLIGAMFVEKGLITEEQLQSALEEQRAGGGRLGEILVERFGISRLDLASALAEQWAEYEQPSEGGPASPPEAHADEPAAQEADLPPAATPEAVADAEPRRPIGEIFLERGLLTAAELDAALQEQRETGQRLGEVLVAKGVVSRLELASALADQWSTLQKLRPPEPAAQPEPDAPAAPPAPDVQELEELRIGVDGLATRLEVGERRLAGVTAALAGVDALRREVEALAATPRSDVVDPATVAALGDRVEQLAATVAALPAAEEAAAPLRAALEAHAARLEALDRERERDRALLERVEALEARPQEPASVAELRDAVASLVDGQTGGDELATGLNELRDAVAELARRQEERPSLDPESLLGPVGARLAAVEERLAEAARAEGRLRDALEPLVREAVAALARDQEALQARLDDVARLAGALEETAARVDSVEARVAAGEELEGRLREELERRLGEAAEAAHADGRELADRLDQAASQTAATAAGADELRSAVSALASRIDDLARSGDDVERLAAQVVERERALEERLRGRFAEGLAEARGSLEVALADQAGRLAAAEARAAELEGLGGRIEELGGRLAGLTGFRSDVRAAGEEQAERLRQLEERARAELEHQVSMLEERLGVRLAQLGSEARGELEQLVGETRSKLEAGVRERLAEQAGRLEQLERTPEALEQLHNRLSELDGRLGAGAAGARGEVDALREQQAAAVGALEERLRAELARSLADRADLSSADAERLAAGLAGIEERLAGTGAELAGRVGGLEEAVGQLAARVDEADASAHELRAALDHAHGAEGQAVEALERARGDLAAAEERLHGQLGEAERRLSEARGELAGRVETVERRAEALERLEEVVGRLAARVDEADASAHELRAALERQRGVEGESALEQVHGELAGLEERLRGLVAQADRRLAQADGELGGRVDGLEELIGRLGERADDAGALAHELRSALEQQARIDWQAVDGVRGELAGLEERLRDRLGEAERRLADAGGELAGRIEAVERQSSALEGIEERLGRLDGRVEDVDASAVAARAGLGEQLGALDARLEAGLAEAAEKLRVALADQERRLEEVTGSVAGRLEPVERALAHAESLQGELARLELRLAELVPGTELEGVRAELRTAVEELAADVGKGRDEVFGALRTSAEELAGLRERQDRHEDLAREREAMLVSARGELAALAERLAALEGHPIEAVETELAAAGAELGRLAARVEQAERRADDADAALAAALTGLGTRVEEGVVRASEQTARVERSLHEELDSLAATLEERDAAAIDARGELREELERVSASLGWRVERLEQALAADDTGELRELVESLAQRVEQQSALADEQVRVTERALRKGLASLGARLAESQGAYVEAGDALRRSIEGLGRAVADAGSDGGPARPADKHSHLAFVPTGEGYRLAELDGKAPDAGFDVDVPGVDGRLRVTRVSRSPLPLDARACIFLERVTPPAG